MKKILYLIITLLCISFVSCKQVDSGAEPETMARVTVYEMDLPEKDPAYNPDGTVMLRFMPNSLCKSMKVLVQLKKEKDAYIDANGVEAYTNKVFEEGDVHTFTEGVTVIDVLYEDRFSYYAITTLALDSSGKPGKVFDFVFYGVNWIPMTNKATYVAALVSPIFTDIPVETYDVKIEYAEGSGDGLGVDGANEVAGGLGKYRLVNVYYEHSVTQPSQIVNSNINSYFIIEINSAEDVSVPAPQDFGVNWGPGVMGIKSVSDKGKFENNIVTFPVGFCVISIGPELVRDGNPNDGFSITIPKQ